MNPYLPGLCAALLGWEIKAASKGRRASDATHHVRAGPHSSPFWSLGWTVHLL